ncbi:MAG: hypothetical protein ACOCSE_03855, partial [Chitinivibrionales bacterium]
MDATGGDGGIRTVLSGIKLIQDNLPDVIGLYLCGPADKIQGCALGIGLNIESDQISIIDSDPSPACVERPSYIWKTHPDSPLVKSITLQKKGLVSASISAGDTAQIISTAIILLGKQKGVKKTPFGVIFPTVSGRKTLVLDVGANPDCKAEHLADFGSMGAGYLSTLMGPNFTPEIKLLNIGIEPEKGNSIIQKADSIL